MKKLVTLTSFLIISTLLVCALGAYLKYDILKPLELYEEESIIEIPFLLIADEGSRYALLDLAEKENMPPETEPPATEPPVTEPSATEATEPPATEAVTEPPTEPVPLDIDESWFDDALFIGDSRTVGLRDIARLGEADYFCAGSMTVFGALEKKCSDKDFLNKTLESVLGNHTYGKVYIHFGLNECSKDHDLIIQKYQEIIDLIRTSQPDAVIILQSIMTVTDYKAEEEKFSMDKIQGLNARIEQLATDNGLFFQDTNEWAADENGFLREEIKKDGAHPTGIGYREWAQWILEQAKYMGIP